MEDEITKAFRVMASTKGEEWAILNNIDKLIKAPYSVKTKILMSHSLANYFINEALIKLGHKEDVNKPLVAKLDIIKEKAGLTVQSYYNIKKLDNIKNMIEKDKSMTMEQLNKYISMMEFKREMTRIMFEKEDCINNLIIILNDTLWELKRVV